MCAPRFGSRAMITPRAGLRRLIWGAMLLTRRGRRQPTAIPATLLARGPDLEPRRDPSGPLVLLSSTRWVPPGSQAHALPRPPPHRASSPIWGALRALRQPLLPRLDGSTSRYRQKSYRF